MPTFSSKYISNFEKQIINNCDTDITSKRYYQQASTEVVPVLYSSTVLHFSVISLSDLKKSDINYTCTSLLSSTFNQFKSDNEQCIWYGT